MQTRVITIDPKKLVLLKVNARYMRHETFMRLVDNIKKDHTLQSVPFCAPIEYFSESDTIKRDDEGNIIYEVLSGNHRVKAAISAGLPEISVMVTDEPMPPDQRKAVQLQHNEITGEDDPATLKMIYSSIEDLSWRMYTGLDDKHLELLDQVSPGALSEVGLEFQPVSFVFLPDELESVTETWDTVKAQVKNSKAKWLVRLSEYDQFMDRLEDVERANGVKNVATALLVMLEIFTRHIDDLQEGFLDQQGEAKPGIGAVPLSAVLGTGFVPAKMASRTKKLIERLMAQQKADSNIEALGKILDAAEQILNT